MNVSVRGMPHTEVTTDNEHHVSKADGEDNKRPVADSGRKTEVHGIARVVVPGALTPVFGRNSPVLAGPAGVPPLGAPIAPHPSV